MAYTTISLFRLRSPSRHLSSLASVPNPLPAAFLRGGTSKGIFINRRHLPAARDEWAPIFLRIMGSPDAEYGRQLNGMGGGISSLSKIVVVGPPSTETTPGIDAEYTFAQVGIRDSEIDFSGNCGNLSSVVGAFAVDEGICLPRIISHTTTTTAAVGTVRMWNTNTNKEIHTTFPLTPDSNKPLLDAEQVSIAGVPGKASQILLDFIDPAGARTGQLLPTGNAVDSLLTTITGTSSQRYTCSLVDATNPTVFITSEDLLGRGDYLPDGSVYTEAFLDRIEDIRRAGASAMGLDPSARAQPKIAILGLHKDEASFSDDRPVDVDIAVQAFSMGVPHRAIPMTVGLCLGVASTLHGTVAHRLVTHARHHRRPRRPTPAHDNRSPSSAGQHLFRISHPGGIVDVGAEFSPDGRHITSAKVVRTGRRLMQGAVWW